MNIVNFLFPRICPHCQCFLDRSEGLFCKECTLFFEPINPQERCFYCFTEHEKRLCENCLKHKGSMIPVGAVWEYMGAISTFMQKLKREQLPSYIKLTSSFLTLQFSRLPFPQPHYIIPVPSFSLNILWKGKSLNTLIAKNLSKDLGIPFKPLLYTNSPSQRRFHLKKKADIEGKNVLLVDVDLPQEQKSQALNLALSVGDPEKVCAITPCYLNK